MVSNKKETIDVMISRFNKNQKTNKSQTLKDNHRSPKIIIPISIFVKVFFI
jgi:translation initiation factor 2 alpha subunit (eIF-2alpha)